MWKISAPARRNLLVICAIALCSLPMYGQTANTGAIAGSGSDPGGATVAGGETDLNGAANPKTMQRNRRIGVTSAIPIARHQSLKLSYDNCAYIN